MIDGPGYFVSSNGKYSPQEELVATIRGMYTDSQQTDEKEKVQCRFLARRDWLVRRLNLVERGIALEPCEQRRAWIKKLDAEAITLIFADAYLNNAASSFGHTFFKIHSKGNDDDRDLLNYGVSYAASGVNEGGGVIFALKGLAGGHPGIFSMITFHEKLKDYANLEGRDVWEYHINLNPSEVDFLVKHLLELEQTYLNYYFFDENCALLLLAVLESARPSLHLTDRFHVLVPPRDITRVALEAGIISEISYRPSLSTVLNEKANQLTHKESKWAKDLSMGQILPAQLDEMGLSKIEKVRSLEVALSHFAVRETKVAPFGKEALRPVQEKMHSLKIARSRLGQASVWAPQNKDVSTSPAHGHDSARFEVGAITNGKRNRPYLGLYLAYHDLMSNPLGHSAGTQVNALGVTATYAEAFDRLVIDKVVVVDLISASPVNTFSFPVSWQFSAGLETLGADRRNTALNSLFGMGLRYDLDCFRKSILMGFVNLNGQWSDHLNERVGLGASVDIRQLTYLSDSFRMLLEANYLRYFSGDTNNIEPRWGYRLNYSLSRNLEVQWDHHWQDTSFEAGVLARYYTIL